MRYDPLMAPDPDAWLNLDEAERTESVLRYHQRAKVRAGSLRVHAIIHVVVETQLAKGHPSAVGALERLVKEGLDRHDAIHAMGSVLSEQMYNALKGEKPVDPEAYDKRLDALSAAAWRREWGLK